MRSPVLDVVVVYVCVVFGYRVCGWCGCKLQEVARFWPFGGNRLDLDIKFSLYCHPVLLSIQLLNNLK